MRKNNLLDSKMPVLYHGSPVKIDDIAFAAGTWLTPDFEIAKEYGEYIYCVIIPNEYENMISGPDWEGHYVTHGHIPMRYIEICE